MRIVKTVETMKSERILQTLRPIRRRAFLAGAAAAAGGLAIVPARAVRGTQANAALRLGVIGCGGRGNFVIDKLKRATSSKIVALADPFRDNAEKLKAAHAEPDAKHFGGLDGYKGLVASDVDAVVITSPPYCHPEQAAAAVAAGKHVWMAKPVAVDTHGCQSVIATGERAKGKVSLFIDFQTRNSPPFREAADRVRRGDIGQIVSGQVYYQAGRLQPHADPKDVTNPATRLKNWVFDKRLSGDIIVEQNVHVLDVSNWYIGRHPLKAYGTGGRKGRTDVGDCWDHFIVIYWYPDDIQIDFSSGQYLKGYSDLCIRMYGTRGTVDSHYGGEVKITGEVTWTGERENTYQEPVLRNARDFEAGIRSGKLLNNAAESAESTLTGILGRIAAYAGRAVTWDEMMAANEKIEPEAAL
ncbi:MAG: Gfo/Idh/MocA family oxidoreductase [Planctomycetes bacterium]|nr:Gfo/Idh/MocA family oxidoreductase [Planctomycetota bacterium]